MMQKNYTYKNNCFSSSKFENSSYCVWFKSNNSTVNEARNTMWWTKKNKAYSNIGQDTKQSGSLEKETRIFCYIQIHSLIGKIMVSKTIVIRSNRVESAKYKSGGYTVDGSGTHCKCVVLGLGVFDSLTSHKNTILCKE